MGNINNGKVNGSLKRKSGHSNLTYCVAIRKGA